MHLLGVKPGIGLDSTLNQPQVGNSGNNCQERAAHFLQCLNSDLYLKQEMVMINIRHKEGRIVVVERRRSRTDMAPVSHMRHGLGIRNKLGDNWPEGSDPARIK